MGRDPVVGDDRPAVENSGVPSSTVRALSRANSGIHRGTMNRGPMIIAVAVTSHFGPSDAWVRQETRGRAKLVVGQPEMVAIHADLISETWVTSPADHKALWWVWALVEKSMNEAGRAVY